MRALGRFLTVVALCLAVGLHWLALQSVAWTTMVVKYSQRVSLVEAVAQTFDGQHPCGLCHAVQKGKSSEKKNDLSAPRRLDLFPPSPVAARVAEFTDVQFALRTLCAIPRVDSPPTPPPRFALA